MALEARLHRSAARLDASRRPCAPHTRAVSAAAEAAEPPAQRRRTRPSGTDDDDALARTPTPEQIAEEIRRRPIGEVICDICRDLGIVPAHPLWQELREAIIFEGGRYTALFLDMFKRPRRLPRPADWPEEQPPDIWAAWRYSAEPAATGPP